MAGRFAPSARVFVPRTRRPGGFSGRRQTGQPPQVVGDGFEGKLELVFDQPDVADDAVALASFPVAKDALDVAPPPVFVRVAGAVVQYPADGPRLVFGSGF